MTDEQKELLEFLQSVADKAKNERALEFKNFAVEMRNLHNSFVEAGFTDGQAFEMTRIMVESIMRGVRK